jgi:hypothetical protein
MIDLTSNWIVVRAIAARLEELESKTAPTAREAAERAHLEGLLARLRVPRGDFPWREYIYPIQLVRDDYFTEYSKQLAQCFGDEVPDNVVIDDSDSVDWEANGSARARGLCVNHHSRADLLVSLRAERRGRSLQPQRIRVGRGSLSLRASLRHELLRLLRCRFLGDVTRMAGKKPW